MQNNDPYMQHMIATTDRLWIELREYNKDIVDYLSGDDNIDFEVINKILHISLRLIISELLVNKEEYEKYPVKNLDIDEFIQLTIVDSGKKKFDYNNQEECEKFMEEIRAIIWGYIKQYYEELSDIIIAVIGDKSRQLTQSNYDRLTECVCVAYIESNFRKREIHFLEREFE